VLDAINRVWERKGTGGNLEGDHASEEEEIIDIIDSDDEAPIILPLLDYNYVSPPSYLGSYFTFDADALVLSRIEGRDSLGRPTAKFDASDAAMAAAYGRKRPRHKPSWLGFRPS